MKCMLLMRLKISKILPCHIRGGEAGILETVEIMAHVFNHYIEASPSAHNYFHFDWAIVLYARAVI